MKILEANNLKIKFGDFTAVESASFFVNEGKVSALVGESGSGKTVSSLSLLSLLNGAIVSGEAIFEGRDLISLEENDLEKVRGKDISFIFQEPMTSLNPLHSIGKQIKEVLLLHKIADKKSAKEKVLQLLDKVHIDRSRYKSHPHQLSGGQRQRVMIAMAIACSPKLLIADEPTTALDVSIQKEILDLLKELQAKMNLSILLITHNLNLVKNYADNIFVMEKGQVVESGDVDIFMKPKHSYTKKLLKANETGSLNKLDRESLPNILEVSNLSVVYDNNFKALDSISFEVKKGETLGVIGESGSGKTSMANAILRLIPIASGDIIFDNQNIVALKNKELRSIRKDIQIVFQDPFSSLSPRRSIYQIIEEPLSIHKIGDKKLKQQLVNKVLKEVGLGDINASNRYPHEFSGGQRQRIAIARALILEPKLIILDEPTSALDVFVQAEILKLLKKIQKSRNISYILISHDLQVVKNSANSVITIDNGHII